jgi:hypothetical protein
MLMPVDLKTTARKLRKLDERTDPQFRAERAKPDGGWQAILDNFKKHVESQRSDR